MNVRPRALIAALACLALGLPSLRAAIGHALLPGHAAQVRQGFVSPNSVTSIIYVSPTGSDSNSNNGQSLAAAKKTIQAGIDAVASGGGTVYIEPGTYTGPGNNDLDLDGSTNQFLGRNITVRSDPFNNGTPANTIININGANQANADNTTGFIITQGETAASLIFGLTLENGNEDKANGGAMEITNGSNPVVQNCIFLNNQAQLGGAIDINDASPTIRECTFTGNSVTAKDSTGGPASDSNSIIGGAIEISLDTAATNTTYTPIITNCVFTGNSAPSDGGAIDITGVNGYQGATAVLSPKITNCTFTGNTSVYVDATGQPGGTIGVFDANPVITNSILYGDTDVSGSSGGEITEVPPIGGTPAAVITTNYDDVQGGVTGSHDTNQNPDFVGAAVGFSSPDDLASNSPEIGAGTTAVPMTLAAGVPAIDVSIDRNANPRNGRIDVGAFENPDTPPLANDQSVIVTINTAKAITLSGTDPSGRMLVYSLATNPAHGTLSGTAPSLTYTPANNYIGPDSFTFTVSTLSGVSSPTTATVSITVDSPPAVTTNPVSQTVTAGQSVTFTAAASGSPSPTVQWQVSTDGGSTFTNVAGATSTSYTFTAAAGQSGNRYRAVFTNAVGSATTTAATLTVNTAPTVTTNPVSQTVTAGQSVTFTAAASGSPSPTVQWQVSTDGGSTFTNVAGATSTSYTFTAAAGQNGNRYRAVFTNSVGSNITNPATLTVNTAPAVTTNPVNQTVNDGQSVTFTAAATGQPSPTVQWQVSTDGGATFTNVAGATSTSLTFTATVGQSGNQYRAVFTNSAGSATTTAATLTVGSSPAVTTNPVSQTVTAGQSVTFTAAASGSPSPTVQWQVSTDGGATFTNVAGATSTSYTFTAAAGQSGNRYRAVFTNARGTATTTAATLTVNQVAVTGASVSWGTAGSSSLTTNADGLRLLPAGRSTDLPWLGITRITLTLSAAAALSPTDVSVTGINVASYGPVTLSPASGSNTSYTLTLAQPISAADRVTLTLGNAGIATYTRRLDVLPGDVSDDGTVALQDAILIRNMYLGFAGATPTTFGDINGDGVVDVNDYNAARMRIGTHLP